MTYEEAQARAKTVGEMRHVAEWIEEFRSVCMRMPKEVFVFAGEDSGSCWVLAKDEQGQHIFRENEYGLGEGLEAGATIEIIDADIEGGGF